jgi:hypothetical protein
MQCVSRPKRSSSLRQMRKMRPRNLMLQSVTGNPRTVHPDAGSVKHDPSAPRFVGRHPARDERHRPRPRGQQGTRRPCGRVCAPIGEDPLQTRRHCDVTEGKRAAAVRAGAVEITCSELTRMIIAERERLRAATKDDIHEEGNRGWPGGARLGMASEARCSPERRRCETPAMTAEPQSSSSQSRSRPRPLPRSSSSSSPRPPPRSRPCSFIHSLI